jgi:5-methylcytosine-specific restriction endonuclease McrA
VFTRVSTGDLPAIEVETRLRDALRDLDTARKNAVMWFAEILARKLYLEFDCSSIHHYARQRLGFSRARTAYFLRLCRSFEQLPALRESVASGAVPWTKAREVVKVATPQTESFWVEQAQTVGRRELERRVAATRGAAKARRRAPGQGELLVANAVAQVGAALGGSGVDPVGQAMADPIVEVPVTVSFTLSPEQYARYEAMLEAARRNGYRGSREELFLAAWEMITRVDTATSREHARRPQAMPQSAAPTSPRYQVVIRQCETCGRAEIATGRGAIPVAPKTLETALCDARVHRHGDKNSATIPPAARRDVLVRDGHRCRTAGCGSARFLDVHHIVPREHGGKNDLDNLVTLCAACHRMIHDRADAGRACPLRHALMADDHPGDQLGDPRAT